MNTLLGLCHRLSRNVNTETAHTGLNLTRQKLVFHARVLWWFPFSRCFPWNRTHTQISVAEAETCVHTSTDLIHRRSWRKREERQRPHETFQKTHADSKIKTKSIQCKARSPGTFTVRRRQNCLLVDNQSPGPPRTNSNTYEEKEKKKKEAEKKKEKKRGKKTSSRRLESD